MDIHDIQIYRYEQICRFAVYTDDKCVNAKTEMQKQIAEKCRWAHEHCGTHSTCCRPPTDARTDTNTVVLPRTYKHSVHSHTKLSHKQILNVSKDSARPPIVVCA